MSWFIQVLFFSTPTGLAALGETVNQKAGQLNIGLEGMMLTAAYFGALGAEITGNPALGLLLGVLSVVPLWIIQNLLTIHARQDQVVVGTGINLAAIGITSTLFQQRYGDAGRLITIPTFARFGGLDALVFFMVVMAPVIWFALHRTAWGLAIRAAGEYPDSVESAGFSVAKLRWQASGIGASLAALAGAHLALSIGGTFVQEMTAGRGFVALAMVSFGRWKPFGVLGACLLVGFAEFLRFYFQVRQPIVPYQFFLALPYVLALVVLIIVGKGTSAPMDLGRPLRSNK
ncbi:MAG: ABC transporter permease [Armatimonadetes bacterium]|nr:ABC transporter permease [Armatimonadota bacterium]